MGGNLNKMTVLYYYWYLMVVLQGADLLEHAQVGVLTLAVLLQKLLHGCGSRDAKDDVENVVVPAHKVVSTIPWTSLYCETTNN